MLTQLPFAPLHMHRLVLKISIDKTYYRELTKEAAPINRAKQYEEKIGRRHIFYISRQMGESKLQSDQMTLLSKLRPMKTRQSFLLILVRLEID